METIDTGWQDRDNERERSIVVGWIRLQSVVFEHSPGHQLWTVVIAGDPEILVARGPHSVPDRETAERAADAAIVSFARAIEEALTGTDVDDQAKEIARLRERNAALEAALHAIAVAMTDDGADFYDVVRDAVKALKRVTPHLDAIRAEAREEGARAERAALRQVLEEKSTMHHRRSREHGLDSAAKSEHFEKSQAYDLVIAELTEGVTTEEQTQAGAPR